MDSKQTLQEILENSSKSKEDFKDELFKSFENIISKEVADLVQRLDDQNLLEEEAQVETSNLLHSTSSSFRRLQNQISKSFKVRLDHNSNGRKKCA